MQSQDYYTLLGISKNASSDQVRKAYRKAARKFHPDINKDKGAEERFKEIGEAYEVLKDAEKRRLYDQYGRHWKEAKNAETHQGFPGSSTGNDRADSGFHFESGTFAGGENLDDILRNLFGGASQFEGPHSGSGWHHAGAADYKKPIREYELQVSLEDVYFGAVKHISLQSLEPDVHGGMKQVNKEIKVTIPKGVTDGSVIRLGGEGSLDEKLHIRLIIAPHRRFTVAGYDLKTAVAVSPWEAILGAKIPVETMDGKVNLTVPKGTQNGKQLRIKGKGLTRKNGTLGDIIVTLDVRLPTGLKPEEEQLLKSVAEKIHFDPRKYQSQRPVVKMAA